MLNLFLSVWLYLAYTVETSNSDPSTKDIAFAKDGLLSNHHPYPSQIDVEQRLTSNSDLLSDSSQQCDSDCEAYTQRLSRYCHTSLFNENKHDSSNEGTLEISTSNQYELVHVHIVARHGDRTPVSNLKLGSKVYQECGLTNDLFNWKGLDDFPPPLILSSQGSNFHIQLNPGSQKRECGDIKGIGMLTALGYKQLALLGKLMQEKYEHFTSNIVHDIKSLKSAVYVQSTYVLRTIHSLSAFMLGFLPDSADLRRATTIHVSPGTLLESPPMDIQRVYHHCNGYRKLWEENLAHSGYTMEENKRRQPVDDLCNMFKLGNKCKFLSIPKVFEQLSIRGCHQPSDVLPCARQNGPCVTYSQALELFQLTDWVWSNRYPLKSSTIALIPFLNHSILTPMQQVIQEYSIQQSTPLAGSYKLMVSLTHDKTITMMLRTLGVPVKEWIPYATRVVFELWKQRASSVFSIRILLNGAVVTNQCGAWRNKMPQELVSFPIFRDFLTSGNYMDLNLYNKICRIT